MKSFRRMVAQALEHVPELMPWDVQDLLAQPDKLLLLDIREPYEYDALHIEGSLNVPRGILESACDWEYEETIPDLVNARNDQVVVICKSGNRSALAARTMQEMGYANVFSLKTGIRGWNDNEQPLINSKGESVDIDDADTYLIAKVREEQLKPK